MVLEVSEWLEAVKLVTPPYLRRSHGVKGENNTLPAGAGVASSISWPRLDTSRPPPGPVSHILTGDPSGTDPVIYREASLTCHSPEGAHRSQLCIAEKRSI